MVSERCATIRMAIETHNFVGWRGLPNDCPATDLFDHVPDDLTGRPSRPLGDDFDPATFVLLDLPGYYRPMMSFRDGILIMFDAMLPELRGGFLPLHADLGEPAARLNWFYTSLEIPNGEWVYPERGITVLVNTNGDRVLHLALYHPTTLAAYKQSLQLHLRKTYFSSATKN